MCECSTWMYVFTSCVCLVSMETRRQHWTAWNWSYKCEPLCEWWDSNSGLQEEQPVFLSAESIH